MRGKFTVLVASLIALSFGAAQLDAQATTKTTTKKTAAKKPVEKTADDADVAAIGGTGVPTGYVGRTDRANAQLSGAKYAVSGNGWNVTTGPAHILYRAADTASGFYTVTATIDQLAAPAHPEAYGIFIGGKNLDGPDQTYLYFLVRGTGEMFAKVREGDNTRGVIAWQPSKAVPAANAAGQATYKIAIQVVPDSVRFWVNDRQAAAIPMATVSMPVDGVYGLRINHNLQVRATPVTLTRP